jgi:peptidoglycan hydrolase CwlO-like protein
MSLYIELQAKQDQLATLQDQLSDLQSKLSDIEANPEHYTNLENIYDDFLDELYAEACEALPISITGSELIKEHDPTMYRCGYSDFCSDYDYASLDIYTDTESEIEDIESEIESLLDEISEIEDQIAEEEEDQE